MNALKLKSLIVDDDKKLLPVLKSLLMEEGHEVTTCDDGATAIQICRREKYDLIITDLMMPGASGLDVLKESRKLFPETLVILITGFASLETAIQAIRAGAYDYIAKPFKLDEIKIVTKNAGEKILLVRENRRLLQELQEAYQELHLLKRIMGTEGKQPEESGKPNRSFIAGNLLTHYYVERQGAATAPFLADLERMTTLREKGFLSEEEFNLCKAKLLKHLP
ncbi:MAG: response regulator [Desulfobacteraceae bacterium]|nr:MAG: response regulator [Desulfobacteraceae bacterium]